MLRAARFLAGYDATCQWSDAVQEREPIGERNVLAEHHSVHLVVGADELDELDDAGDWKTARDRLLDLHQLVADEVTIIPLWQLTESFAYRRGLTGISERPATLYQDIEKWHTAPDIHPFPFFLRLSEWDRSGLDADFDIIAREWSGKVGKSLGTIYIENMGGGELATVQAAVGALE